MKKRMLTIALRWILWQIALLWGKSLRISKINNGAFNGLHADGKNYVVAFWHGSMFVGWFVHRPKNGNSVSALVSQSNDGEYLSIVLEQWGYSMIRGSSHIGGKEAMQLMVDALAGGSSLAITPDGPRGPRHEMKMGAVRAAQKASVPLVLAGIVVKKKRLLHSWDRFEVPLPFSKVIVNYSNPIIVPSDCTGDPLDELKLEMQRKLWELTDEADRKLESIGRNL
ncbi:MAG: lysophospholipid acyltransferase family protein [Bacteroidetes bacterium]|nr:lysophospholipid acyltransferase family protein [Bacteroidota bacterium]